jgi:hypothetical protein
MVATRRIPPKKGSRGRARARPAGRTRFRGTAIVLLAVAVMIAAGFWWRSQIHVDAQAATAQRFERLTGQWLRSDGGYVIDIKRVDADGRMDASYFNPRSIHVSRAEASMVGASPKVLLELRDENYPGSRYDLTYDAALDALSGEYYQAALQQRFAVTFARVK